jgi:isoleucyl-tRNA synthetase
MYLKHVNKCLQRFGVWADWNNPYLTLDPEYEAAQVAGTAFLVYSYGFTNRTQIQNFRCPPTHES